MAKPKRGRSTAAIDDHVGARIRERRIMLGLTQQQLAEMIGVTYQQAHKLDRKARGRSRHTSACCSRSPAISPRSETSGIKRRSASLLERWQVGDASLPQGCVERLLEAIEQRERLGVGERE